MYCIYLYRMKISMVNWMQNVLASVQNSSLINQKRHLVLARSFYCISNILHIFMGPKGTSIVFQIICKSIFSVPDTP